MKSGWMTVGFCALAFSIAASPAHAAPEDRTISYTIYNDPEHPQLGIRYHIELGLAFAATSGNRNGWEIERVRIARMRTDGTLDEVWTDLLPEVMTADGLWWTTHVNSELPLAKEFTAPPLLAGFASAATSGRAAMEYSLNGTVCTSDCKTAALTVPAIVGLRLQEVDDDYPDFDEGEEPVGTDDDVDE
ncbi:MAG TPA: hypothetical protein VNT79_18120 [Phycisphaerae bacterium]|nr:hypothetical protein [Phycisphaerae bacterium]